MFYILIGILIFFLSLYYDFSNGRNHNKQYWINLLLIILIAIPALRYRVGGDTLSYMDEYNEMPSLSNLNIYKDYIASRYQPLWILFVASLKSVSPNFLLLQIIHAVIVNTIIFYILKKNCKYIFLAIFLYYIYAYFKFNFEILREALAICVIGLSINSCIQKKWFKYYLHAIVAYSIHDSALIMFFLPFLFSKKINVVSGIIITIVSIIFFIYSKQIFDTFFSYNFLSDKFILRAFMYIESNQAFSIQGVLYYVLIYVLFPILVYYIGRHNGVYTIVDDFFSFYIFIGIVSSIIPGLYRFSNYQILFSIIYFSNFSYQIRIRNQHNKIWHYKNLLITSFIIFILSYRVFLIQFRDTSNNYPGTRYYNLYYPYYTIFNPKIYYPREQMVYNMWNELN